MDMMKGREYRQHWKRMRNAGGTSLPLRTMACRTHFRYAPLVAMLLVAALLLGACASESEEGPASTAAELSGPEAQTLPSAITVPEDAASVSAVDTGMPSGFPARIIDDQGEPVAGAAVRWVDTMTLENGSAMTDATGGFLLPPGGTTDRLLVIRAFGYATGAHTLSAQDSRLPETYVIHREPRYRKWVMAFAARSPIPYTQNKTGVAAIYLAHSDDGEQWILAEENPIGMLETDSIATGIRQRNTELAWQTLVAAGSPAVVSEDGRIRVYSDDRLFVREPASGIWMSCPANHEPTGWTATGPMDTPDRNFGFFNFQVCPILVEGQWQLFGKNALKYGYPALDLPYGMPESVVTLVGRAQAVQDGCGAMFRCGKNRLVSRFETGLFESEPCIFPYDTRWMMLTTSKEGLLLHVADKPEGPYRPWQTEAMPEGVLFPMPWKKERGWDPGGDLQEAEGLAGACVVADEQGDFHVYLSRAHQKRIWHAITRLDKPLAEQDFSVVLDESVLSGARLITGTGAEEAVHEVDFIGNPSVCLMTEAPVTQPWKSVVAPLAMGNGKTHTLSMGGGSSRLGHSGGLGEATLTASRSGDGPCFSFAIPEDTHRKNCSNGMVQAVITLPREEGAFAGLVTAWQDQGQALGGNAFWACKTGWSLQSFRVGMMMGIMSPIVSENGVRVLAEGALPESLAAEDAGTGLNEGDAGSDGTRVVLTMAHLCGRFALFANGQEIAQVPYDPEISGLSPHLTGTAGVCCRLAAGSLTQHFVNVRELSLDE